MDVIELIKAVLYGLVEGVTEWVPVSSTAHLLLLRHALTLRVSSGLRDLFVAALQLGAAAAVGACLLPRLNPWSVGRDAPRRRAIWRLWGKVLIGCAPAAVATAALGTRVASLLGGPLVIAVMLVAYGVALVVLETLHERSAPASLPSRPSGRHLSAPTRTPAEVADAGARVRRMADLDAKTALGVGACQVLALVPGVSLATASLVGGLALGCSRSVATRFALLVSAPIMLVTSLVRLGAFLLAGGSLGLEGVALLLAGAASSFAAASLAVRLLVRLVRTHDLRPFGWYRIALGILVVMCAIALW